ncbi:MAG: stage II sporulation protein M [Candidatus Nanosalina sp.]
MLERIFLLEEEKQNFRLLAVLGLLSGIVGFTVARILFPSQSDILSVLFAAIPLIYSLTEKFLEDESEKLPHVPEVEMYLSIFAGLSLAFGLLSVHFPGSFDAQSAIVGLSSAAVQDVSFSLILTNNLTVFSSIFIVSMFIGSAGAFILSWNASVFGVFMAKVASSDPLMTLSYLPHSLFEMSGFVIGGIAGSLISAAAYRGDFDREIWMDYIKLLLAGIGCIVIGALLETV